MIVLGGSASALLAGKVAKELGSEPGRLEIKRFPDGEKYIRILESVNGADVAVIESVYPTPDEHIFELLLLLDTLRDLGARSITGVVPYLVYTRQDARFYSGEAVTSLSLARLFQAAGMTSFLTVDTHLHRLNDVSGVFKIPARNLSAMPLLGKYALENFRPRKPIIIGPDAEAEVLAGAVAKELAADHAIFHKKRIRAEGATSSKVVIDTGNVNVTGRDVIFADDMITTGGTIAEAAKACKRKGAKRVLALCTHPVLSKGALKRLRAAGVSKVVGTDTIPSPISKVSVAPVIAAALKASG